MLYYSLKPADTTNSTGGIDKKLANWGIGTIFGNVVVQKPLTHFRQISNMLCILNHSANVSARSSLVMVKVIIPKGAPMGNSRGENRAGNDTANRNPVLTTQQFQVWCLSWPPSHHSFLSLFLSLQHFHCHFSSLSLFVSIFVPLIYHSIAYSFNWCHDTVVHVMHKGSLCFRCFCVRWNFFYHFENVE